MSKRWSNDEKQELMEWLDKGWDFHFPGYEQAALYINRGFGNGRTANACRLMGMRIHKQDKITRAT